MSTKSTMLYSADNEHWYHDCCDDTFVIEFDKKHLDDDGSGDGMGMLVIKRGTPLYRAIAIDINGGKVCANCGMWTGLAKCDCGSTRFYHDSLGEAIDA